jgi:hypothetical protein
MLGFDGDELVDGRGRRCRSRRSKVAELGGPVRSTQPAADTGDSGSDSEIETEYREMPGSSLTVSQSGLPLAWELFGRVEAPARLASR